MKVLIQRPDGATTLHSSRLRIGRAATADIHLDDPRCLIDHAEITIGGGLLGRDVTIDALGELLLWVDDRPVRHASLKPGAQIRLGGYTITVLMPPPGVDLALQLSTLGNPHEAKAALQAQVRSASDSGGTRRWAAWLGLLFSLLLGLTWPLYSHYQTGASAARTRDAASSAAVATSGTAHVPRGGWVWDVNQGISAPHRSMAADCRACHDTPFTKVPDQRCTSCHSAMGQHPAKPALAQEPPFSAQTCTSCHTEHHGRDGLLSKRNTLCTDCHADPASLPGRKLQAVSSFTKDHPGFSVLLPKREGENWIWQDVPLAAKPTQERGVKFPHDVHLKVAGVDAPEGKRSLDCASCHQVNADRSSFLPVKMEAHCADCHRLDFDKLAPDRRVPHGSVAQAEIAIKDFYARLALGGGVTERGAPPVVATRRRPGDVLPPHLARAALAWADNHAALVLRDLVERRSCNSCHVIGKDPQGGYLIAPPAPSKPRWSGVLFDHSRHQTAECTSCHAADRAKSLREVLMPNIGRCKDCHGDSGSMTETPSPCALCHQWHQHPAPASPNPKTQATGSTDS